MTSERKKLGAQNGWLSPCPDAPNCVSTQADSDRHAMRALSFEGEASAAINQVAAVLRAMPGAKLVTVQDDYLHAEFASSLFRFVDDVEFYADSATHRMHFRSASRLGRWDFGVNRRRMTDICRELVKIREFHR